MASIDARRISEASSGKIPTTSVRRAISRLKRSSSSGRCGGWGATTRRRHCATSWRRSERRLVGPLDASAWSLLEAVEAAAADGVQGDCVVLPLLLEQFSRNGDLSVTRGLCVRDISPRYAEHAGASR